MKDISYKSMGTDWKITIWDDVPEKELEIIEKEIHNILEDFDQTYSRFIETSLVSKIAKEKGTYTVPRDFIEMLKIYFELYLPSEKKLNPLIGFTISDLGYDAKYSLTPKENIRKTPDLMESVKIINDCEIETFCPVLFDFGALGKGYAVDKVSDFLKCKSLQKFLVNGSGDIYYRGNEKIKVGLEDPEDENKVIGTIEMNSGAMCASSTNRRKWREYHHMVDPTTSLPTERVTSVWVITEKAVWADALASCLFFVPPENLEKNFKFEYCILDYQRKIKYSAGFKADFF